MHSLKRDILLGAGLTLLSALVYGTHYLLFHDAHHIFIYLLGDIGFVFIEVLLVVLIIEKLLERREKVSRLQKLNVVIGAFFSEVGHGLLSELSRCDNDQETLQQNTRLAPSWQKNDFANAGKFLNNHKHNLRLEHLDWAALKHLLCEKHTFLLRLLENPTLLEHELFTDLTQAIFHLHEELNFRTDIAQLDEEDRKHLGGDAKRVYRHLTSQWLQYMQHQKENYPFLYSLSCRMNPCCPPQ